MAISLSLPFRARRLGFVGLMTLVAACDAGADGGTRASVRDSAGVAIIENPDAELPEWTLASEPAVDIGSPEGGQGQDLVMPRSSTRLSDGRIVVSDGGTNRLLLYDSVGEMISTIARSGGGPGEFASVAVIYRPAGDTLLVSDARRARLTFFDPAGDLLRSHEMELIDGKLPRLRGVVTGSVAVYRVGPVWARPSQSKMRRDTSELLLRALGSSAVTRVGRFAGDEWYDQASGRNYSTWALPFSRGFFTATADTLLWVAVSDAYEIRGYDPSGTLRRIVRLDRPVEPVTPDDQRRFFQHRIRAAANEQERASWSRAESVVEFPQTHPAFADLVADTDGFLWVREYARPWADRVPTWRVFSEDGVAVAMVRGAPDLDDLDVHEIGRDYVLGRWTDSLHVQHIRLFRLMRHEGSPPRRP